MTAKFNRTVAVIGLVACLVPLPSLANYSESIKKLVLNEVIQDPKGWTVYKYPVDNFGIGTMYDGPTAKDFLCATNRCLGIVQDVDLKKYVDDGDGGNLSITDSQDRSAILSVILGRIAKLVGFSADADYSKVVTTQLEITRAQLRWLARDAASDAITGTNLKSVKHAFDNGTLRVVVGDVVLEGFHAKVTLDSKAHAGLIAKLNKATASSPGAPVTLAQTPSQDANSEAPGLTVKISATGNGTYEITTPQPIVVAVLVKTQKKSGQFESSKNWEDWTLAPTKLKE